MFQKQKHFNNNKNGILILVHGKGLFMLLRSISFDILSNMI